MVYVNKLTMKGEATGIDAVKRRWKLCEIILDLSLNLIQSRFTGKECQE